jgi:hypothetical protein
MPTWDDLFTLKVQTQTELTSADKRIRNRAKKIGSMHRKFGKGPDGAICRDCVNCYTHRLSKSYTKCKLFGHTGGPGTDWNQKWPACGKFQERT